MSRVVRQIMRAVRVSQFGGPEVLKLESQVPVPSPSKNEVSLFFFNPLFVSLSEQHFSLPTTLLGPFMSL